MSNARNLCARTQRRTREVERGPLRLGLAIAALAATTAGASIARYQFFVASVPRMPGGVRR